MRRRISLLGVALATGTAACSFVSDFDGYTFTDDPDGGTDGSVIVDTTPPEVVSTTPTGTLVDGRTPIVITFSEPVVATNSDVTVTLDTAMTIAGSVTTEGNTIRFVPTNPFTAVGSYEVVVGTGVTDVVGHALASPATFQFVVPTTGNGGATPRRIDTLGTGDVTCPHFAMDSRGNATLLFARGGVLYTARYAAGAGWSETAVLATGTDPVLSVSPGGRVAVAYTGVVGGTSRTVVRVSASVDDPTFGAASLADEGAVHAVDSSGTCSLENQTKNVAVNDAGQVAVIWKVMTPTGGDPIVGWTYNVRTPAGAWGTATFSNNYPYNAWPQKPGIAVDGTGNAALVFLSFSTDNLHAFRRYDGATSTWLTATTGDLTGSNYSPQLAVDAQGFFTYALATYNPSAPSNSVVVRSARFDGSSPRPANSWTAAMTPFDVFASSANGPWVVWRVAALTSVTGLFGNSWDGNATFLSDSNVANPVIVGTDVVLANESRAIVAYERINEVRWSRVARVPPGGIDGGVVRTLPTGPNAAHDPRITYDVPGQHGMISWITDDPTGRQLFVTEFHSLPPSSL